MPVTDRQLTRQITSSLSRLLRPFFLAAALLLFAAACQTSPPPAGFPDQASANSPTVLVPGDVIGLVFAGAPDLNQSQKIRPDGKITLPLIGEVSAAGKSFAAFQAELEAKYKSQLKNTEVAISLENSNARSIIVDGAVGRPGSIPCDRPLTAFEAVMLAGGFAPDADMKKVQVIRLVAGEHRSVFVDLRKAMSGEPTRVVSVLPGDIIFVPEKFF